MIYLLIIIFALGCWLGTSGLIAVVPSVGIMLIGLLTGYIVARLKYFD